MRNSTNFVITQVETSQTTAEETIWSLPGGVIGFVSWLLALGTLFLVYGPNTLFFFLYTWPFFLALMPLAVVAGIVLYVILHGKLIYSCLATLFCVALMFGMLFLWLMG